MSELTTLLNETLFRFARIASINGCLDAIRDGADVNARNVEGKTSTYIAAAGGCAATFKRICFHGGDTEVRCNQKGGTALHAAAIGWPNGDYNVHTLMSFGADVDARDNKGLTPLHWVMIEQAQNHLTAEGLLKEGADVNAKDYEGNTPLALLDQWGPNAYQTTRKMLLTWGACCC